MTDNRCNAYRLCTFLLFGRNLQNKSCFEELYVHFMWVNLLRFNVRSTFSSVTYARIRRNACFTLD